MQILNVAFLLCLLLIRSSGGFAVRLAVVSQAESHVDNYVIERAVNQLVNKNWNYPAFQASQMSLELIHAVDSVEAVKKVCQSPGLSGMVVVGPCQFVADVLKISGSIQLPTIVVHRGLCRMTSVPEAALVFSSPASDFLRATVAVLDRVSATLVAVFYDSHQDHFLLEQLQHQLSEKRIASVIFQIDNSVSNLTHILQNSIKAQIRHAVVLCEPGNVPLILEQAVATSTLQINYFWTVIDTGIAPRVIEDLIPANKSANILLIRESAIELSRMDCPIEVRIERADCTLRKYSILELKAVEALLSFASALDRWVGTVALPASNASCWPRQPWAAGPVLAGQLKQQRLSPSNASVWWQSSPFLETLGLHNDRNDSAKFVASGHFSVENDSLVATFKYRENQLLFPNTFVDFKGARLRVCAPPFPPYTKYANYTFGEPSGHTVEMINYFTRHLNFKYDLFCPPDVQFGAPVPGSPYFTGCIGMLQKGEADFAMLFATTTFRQKFVDYSDEYQFSSNTILVKLPPPQSKLWNVFAPLSWDSWLLIIALFVVVPVVIYIFARLSPYSAWTLGLPYAFSDEVWLKEYIWSVIGSFLQQGQDFYPFAMSPRTIMAFWWLLTVVIFGAYTGDLTAKLAVTVATYPIQSVDDLVAMPHYKAMVAEGTNIYGSIMMATEGPLALLRKQMVLVDTMTTCAETLLKPDADPYLVCISDQSSNSYYASAFCSQVYQAEKFFNYYYLAMTFPKDAYYLPAFDFLLQRGKESGFVDVVTRKYVPMTSDCSATSAAAEAAAIPLEGVGGAYIVSLSLYLCGGLILLIELFWVVKLGRDPLDLPGY